MWLFVYTGKRAPNRAPNAILNDQAGKPECLYKFAKGWLGENLLFGPAAKIFTLALKKYGDAMIFFRISSGSSSPWRPTRTMDRLSISGDRARAPAVVTNRSNGYRYVLIWIAG